MKKKVLLIAVITVLMAAIIGLIVWLGGRENKQPEAETQNPFQSVYSPQTTEKPKQTLSDSGHNTDDRFGEIS